MEHGLYGWVKPVLPNTPQLLSELPFKNGDPAENKMTQELSISPKSISKPLPPTQKGDILALQIRGHFDFA